MFLPCKILITDCERPSVVSRGKCETLRLTLLSYVRDNETALPGLLSSLLHVRGACGYFPQTLDATGSELAFPATGSELAFPATGSELAFSATGSELAFSATGSELAFSATE